MKFITETGPNEVKKMDTAALRDHFIVQNLMTADEVQMVYSSYERFVIGGVKPIHKTLSLDSQDALKSAFFLERREVGIINLGGSGKVEADGQVFTLEKLSCVYLGKGTKDVQFSSTDNSNPACFFLLSTPAHASFPNQLYTKEDASPVELGLSENCNQRTIYKYIHNDGIQSCQLVMGLTVLKNGSIWNTMPSHTHDRRSEVYFYFDIPENNVVFHFMGQPDETRHLVIQNQEAIISPPWSIHSGAGTASYGFIWGMGGENKDFTDMDMIAIPDLK